MESDDSPLIQDGDDLLDDNDEDNIEVSIKSNSSRTDQNIGTGNVATLVHLLKGNIGIGILSLPSAMKSGGILLCPILLLVVAVLAVHSMHLLVRCAHFFCRKTKKSALAYGEVAFECAKPIMEDRSHIAQVVVDVFLVVTQVGFCSIYLVLGSSTIVEIAGLDDGYRRIMIFLLAVPTILFSFIRSLERLAYVSFLANLLCLFGLISIFQYCARNLKDPSTYPLFGNVEDLPMCLSMVIFSYETIGVILPLENSMKSPKDLTWVVNLGMGISTTLFILMGLLGYIAFGDKIDGSVTLNLPHTIFYNSVKVGYALAMFLSYFIQFYVPMQIMIPALLNKYQRHPGSCFEFAFRACVVLLTAIAGAAIPQVENFISLIGAVASSSLALIFPPLFHMLTFRGNGLKWYEVVKDVFIMFVGLTGFVLGGYVSVVNIVAGFHTSHTDAKNATVYNAILRVVKL